MNTYTQAMNAVRDAEREFMASGGDEAKARAETDRPECPCCVAYDRPGMIWNAGAWMRCPMCNPAALTKARGGSK